MKADVRAVITEARERGVPGLERRVEDGPSQSRALAMHAALGKLFAWLTGGPAQGEPLPRAQEAEAAESRERVLSKDEIVAFWKAAEAEPVLVGHILKLLLLTGTRLNEVVKMRRAELSEDLAEWSLPRERTKNDNAYVVPLSPMAQDILKTVAGDGAFVFSTNGGRGPVEVGSRVKRRL